jgi:hypothetical protein
MIIGPALLFSFFVVFTCAGASAAQVSGRDRDNILMLPTLPEILYEKGITVCVRIAAAVPTLPASVQRT